MWTRKETWQKLVKLGAVSGDMPIGQWDLSDADLRGANLTKAELTGAELTGAELTGADLSDANLTRANLTEADLRGANLTGANLTEARLVIADLTDAYLIDATLIRTDLTKAILNGADIDNANLTEWIIKDVTCTHIVQAKYGSKRIIKFAPQEFEKKYTHIEKIAELILSIPLTESASFIGSFLAQSINHLKKSTVMTWKGVEALSDGDTKLTFNIFDNDFYINQKEVIETTLKDTLNDYFKENPLGESITYFPDPIEDATEGIVKIKKELEIFQVLAIDTQALQEKALSYFLRIRKTGEDVYEIVTSIFR
jgi:hypothetical protein